MLFTFFRHGAKEVTLERLQLARGGRAEATVDVECAPCQVTGAPKIVPGHAPGHGTQNVCVSTTRSLYDHCTPPPADKDGRAAGVPRLYTSRRSLAPRTLPDGFQPSVRASGRRRPTCAVCNFIRFICARFSPDRTAL